jgi:hypothetical protein
VAIDARRPRTTVTTARRDDKVAIELPARPPELLRGLLVAATALAAVSAAATTAVVLGTHIPHDLVARFDVDGEMTVPAWYSALQLFLCALLIVSIAHRSRGSRFARHWWVLAAGFVFLSLDEAASYHEAVNDKVHSLIGHGPTFIWAIPGMIVAGIVGLLFVPFLRHLPTRTGRLFVVAGFTFVSAAAGLELVGSAIIDAHGGPDRDDSTQNLPYIAETTIEEFLEMASVALFAYALASYDEMSKTTNRRGQAGAIVPSTGAGNAPWIST